MGATSTGSGAHVFTHLVEGHPVNVKAPSAMSVAARPKRGVRIVFLLDRWLRVRAGTGEIEQISERIIEA